MQSKVKSEVSSSDTTNISGIKHVAVIMDGNGRWAKNKGLPRSAGHKKGADVLKQVCGYCIDHHIDYLTVYAFSSENWNRSNQEVQALMNLLRFYMDKELDSFNKNGIRLRVIGNRLLLAPDIIKKIKEIEDATRNNDKLTAVIALSYGAREEIVNTTRQIAKMVQDNKIEVDQISEELFGASLYSKDIPDPDLLIRTGGEIRLSNFLLWQMAYTELYFTEALWPDFSKTHFEEALKEYSTRERRFGKV